MTRIYFPIKVPGIRCVDHLFQAGDFLNAVWSATIRFSEYVNDSIYVLPAQPVYRIFILYYGDIGNVTRLDLVPGFRIVDDRNGIKNVEDFLVGGLRITSDETN